MKCGVLEKKIEKMKKERKGKKRLLLPFIIFYHLHIGDKTRMQHIFEIKIQRATIPAAKGQQVYCNLARSNQAP